MGTPFTHTVLILTSCEPPRIPQVVSSGVLRSSWVLLLGLGFHHPVEGPFLDRWHCDMQFLTHLSNLVTLRKRRLSDFILFSIFYLYLTLYFVCFNFYILFTFSFFAFCIFVFHIEVALLLVRVVRRWGGIESVGPSANLP